MKPETKNRLVKVRNEGSAVILENFFLCVAFQKSTGLLQISDPKSGRVLVEDAYFEVNCQSSDEKGTTCSAVCEKQNDEFGEGMRMTVFAVCPGGPERLLRLTLYRSKPFLSLAVGLRNTTRKDIRMKQAAVLCGRAFPGLAFSNYRVLNGETDIGSTQIESSSSVVSRNNLLVLFGESGDWHSCGMGGLSYHDFQKYFRVTKNFDSLDLELSEKDPVGRLVESDEEYLPDDRFYFDPVTADPFRNLEDYGIALRTAQKIDLTNPVDLVLNHWYPSQERFGKMEERNNSAGTLLTMREAVRSGLGDYTQIGIRLEPDDYSFPDNQQGWWDDEHFAKYPSGGLVAPYDTMQKWGDAIAALGGICMLYFQSGRTSKDYARLFPGHMLFNSSHAKRSRGGCGWWNGGKGDECWGYDYTDPGFQKHLADVYTSLRNAGIKGIKFDYPDTAWCYDGGFEDKKATAASAYRCMYQAARAGLGRDADLQDRLGRGDLASGIISTKRTEPDMDRLYPPVVTRSGLKWYKNRVIYYVDTDVKNPLNAMPNNLDGVRAMFTMTYLISGRIELGIYTSALDQDRRHALTRILPFYTAPKSARPADAFCGKKYGQVYDFEIDSAWHEVAFYNTALQQGDWPEDWESLCNDFSTVPAASTVGISLSGDPVTGSLRLNPHKSYYVYDFWNDCFVGKFHGYQRLERRLRPGEAQMLAVHEVVLYPQFLSTNRHILQGYVDLAVLPVWKADAETLSGSSRVVRDDLYEVVIAGNGFSAIEASADGADCSVQKKGSVDGLFVLSLLCKESRTVAWSVRFKKQPEASAI